MVKYCPSCGKAGVEGMKFCPRCGQRLTGLHLEEKQRYVNQSEAPLKERNWFERHLNWALLLGVTVVPFLLFWIVYGVAVLIALFAPSLAGWIVEPLIVSTPIALIAVIVIEVRWYLGKRRERKTVAGCDKAIELNSHNADAYYKRGDAYDEVGEYGRAITDYNKVIELNPNHVDAYYKRGCAYGDTGEYEKAIADYSTSISLDPNYASAYYNRGVAYGENGEAERAAADLKRCIELSIYPQLRDLAQQALRRIGNSPREG